MLRTERTGFLTTRRVSRLLVAVLAMTATLAVAPSGWAATTEGGTSEVGTSEVAPSGALAHFGQGNVPAGCEEDLDPSSPRWWSQGGGGVLEPAFTSSTAVCHHQRTGQNRLDSPQIDVLILAPVTEPERTVRLAQQSVAMWEGGVQLLSRQMGLDWLAEGLDFHVTVDRVDTGEGGGEFTTYPIVDPEIVVVLGVNPVGTFGMGTTPVGVNLCHGIANPFDLEAWEALPGWDSHHDGRDGLYTEDCGGAGGDTCFAINTTIDTSAFAWDSMFDLVSHELGHCLSVGHVGDGAEGGWGGLPPDDIMAYAEGVEGTKCVSTLNVESFALRMSHHLDVDGDGQVGPSDVLVANNADGGGYKGDGHPFHVMHPDDYRHASSTGRAQDCPQPDAGLLPGTPPNWQPEAVETTRAELRVTSPMDGAENQTGRFTVVGEVERVELAEPRPTSVAHDDPDDDAALGANSEVLDILVDVTATDLTTTIAVAQLEADGPTSTSYDVVVGGRRFTTSRAADGTVSATDRGAAADTAPTAAQLEASWDDEADVVTMRIARDHLEQAGIAAPYEVAVWTYTGVGASLRDDVVPDGLGTVRVHGPEEASLGVVAPVPAPVGTQLQATTFEHDGPAGNTFYPEQSTLGISPFVDGFTGVDLLDPTHFFTLDVPQVSEVEFTLAWVDAVGGADLDLYVTGAADSGTAGATATSGEPVETFVLTDVQGHLDIAVEPYLVTDPLRGATYTLTAQVTPTGTDTDGDGVLDDADLCPQAPGDGPTGCPDTDGDGVRDHLDACPGTPGTAANGCPDGDGDGIDDATDACPQVAGSGPDGCPVAPTEHVEVFTGAVLLGSQAVDTTHGPDPFAIELAELAEGTHQLRVVWTDEDGVVASVELQVTHDVDDDDDGVPNADDACPGFDDALDGDGDGIPDGCDPEVDGDRDGDGVATRVDNCPSHPNPDQADLDGDGRGDACDHDLDGDGHADGKEAAHGTDPRDPASYPTKDGQAT